MEPGTNEAQLRVLVVEDEYLIARDIQETLARIGCAVIGPVPTVAEGLRLIEQEDPEFAILDVNLRGQRSTPLAEALRARGVPFALATGYSDPQLPEEAFREAPSIGKPFDTRALCRVLAELAQPAASDPR